MKQKVKVAGTTRTHYFLGLVLSCALRVKLNSPRASVSTILTSSKQNHLQIPDATVYAHLSLSHHIAARHNTWAPHCNGLGIIAPR